MRSAEYWIKHLDLQAHPEGGFYKETYRSTEGITQEGLPDRFSGDRSFSTAIYFLLRSEDRSVFHRIKSDELWHFHAGGPLHIYVLQGDKLVTHKLGPDPEKGESLQVVIPARCWFGGKVAVENSYTLSGCTVSPGFDFQDFEIADRNHLLRTFPAQRNIIELLT
ncbi:MAG TPA: cupin domain-containing protein [Ohtaekwangia sp.]